MLIMVLNYFCEIKFKETAEKKAALPKSQICVPEKEKFKTITKIYEATIKKMTDKSNI